MRVEVDLGQWDRMAAELALAIVDQLGAGQAATALELDPAELERIADNARAEFRSQPRRAVKISPIAVDLDSWPRMLAMLLIRVIEQGPVHRVCAVLGLSRSVLREREIAARALLGK